MKTYSSEMIEKQFLEFESPRGFRRIDANHTADWYLGLDENGNSAIRLIGSFKPKLLANTSAIAITHYSNQEKVTFQLALVNKEFRELFINLCSDLVSLTENKSTNDAYEMSLIRIESWKSMFQSAPRAILEYSQIVGLIGELLFLKDYVMKSYSIEDSVRSWSGTEKTKKDFSIGNKWFEVKTTSSSSGKIRISSVEQLDTADDDQGHIVYFQLERMSGSYGGVTLNELVNEIGNQIGSSESFREYTRKIDLSGYQFHEDYDQFQFSYLSGKLYLISDNFPRLLKTDLPEGIISAAYDIDASSLSEFYIGEIV